MSTLRAALEWTGPERAQCQVLLWAESSELGLQSPKALARGPVAAYPAALDSEVLRAAVAGYGRAIGVAPPSGEAGARALRLPTFPQEPRPGRPAGGSRPEAAYGRFRSWSVPILRVDFVEALPWLAALPANDEPESLPRLGNDLRYLSRVSKFVLVLLLRRKVVPSVRTGRTGSLEGRWKASLTTDEELAEGERLKALAPGSLLSVGAASIPPGPGSLIRALLDAGVDGLARKWLASGPPVPRRDLPEGRWVSALMDRDPELRLTRSEGGELRQGIEAWTGQPADEPVRYRTCLRLDPPPNPAADPAEGKGPISLLDASEGPWRLHAFLQARDDPTELIPASDVLGDPPRLPARAGRDAGAVAERFLRELRQATRIHPPLSGLLAQRLPSALQLSTAEAYEFLRVGAPLLAECGVGILAPPWWATRQPPLGARVMARPASISRGLFGLDSLLAYDLVIALGEHPLTADELERLSELKVPLVRHRGQWVEIRPEDVAAALRALGQPRRPEGRTLRELLAADIEGHLNGTPILGVVPSGELRELWLALRGDLQFAEVEPPTELRVSLRPYQTRGFSWLHFWRRLGLGVCLADDMGLGKTVQCLAALLFDRRSGGPRPPVLLVCPTSVVENWRREAARFTPTLTVRVHHGEARPRRPAQVAARYRGADLVLTSYALLWRDAELLQARTWDTVVLDEAQNIKNPTARVSRAAFGLTARHRLALTGTPVENRLSELWSIMEFLNPGLLGPLATFESRFATRIERFSDAEAARTLQRLVRPLILRRLKSDPAIVPDLPAKIEQRTDCPLTREQASLYEATVREMMQRIEASDGMDRRAQILTLITRLKQVCDHPALLLKDRSRVPGRSGKLERLEELLEEALAEGDSALVFTQWREMGEMLRRRIAERFGCPVGFFHGGLSLAEREQLLGEFRASRGPRVLVLTLKAGGSGLNLAEASRVFHFDRWWNPAVENQATDRAYRIGQERRVMVHKLVVRGTVEDRIDTLLAQKTGLAESVLTHGEAALTELSTAELRELFALQHEGPAPAIDPETSERVPLEAT